MNLIRSLKGVKKALLIGIGGGGDIVSTIPIGAYLEELGIECIYGGVVWERFRRDPKPGPRAVNEVLNVKVIYDSLCLINSETRIETENGLIQPIVSIVSEFLGCEVLGVDITKPSKLKEDMRSLIENEDIDLLIGVDAGGDVLAKGNEKGLVSPLADSIMLSILKDFKSMIAITGFGSDGELGRSEIESYLSELASKKAVLGCNLISYEIAEKISELAFNTHTESSKVPVISAMGEYGVHEIWDGNKIEVSILNALVFYLDSRAVYHASPLPKVVENCKDILEANSRLNDMGIKTELDLEFDLLEKARKG
jgi:hypothetical protein